MCAKPFYTLYACALCTQGTEAPHLAGVFSLPLSLVSVRRCGISDDGSSKEAEQYGKRVTTAHSELLLAIKQTTAV